MGENKMMTNRKSRITSIGKVKRERYTSPFYYEVLRNSLKEGSSQTIVKEFKTFEGAISYLNKLGFDTIHMTHTLNDDLSVYEGLGYHIFQGKR